MEVIMVTARANDLDMEAAPLDPLGLGDTRLRRAQALPQQIKPRKSLLIVVAADKFAEDNNSPSPTILEIRSLNIPASRNYTSKLHHFEVLLNEHYRKDPSFSCSRNPQFSKWNPSRFILTKKKQPSVFFFKVRWKEFEESNPKKYRISPVLVSSLSASKLEGSNPLSQGHTLSN